jgi:histidine phosphotransfer protein HptB
MDLKALGECLGLEEDEFIEIVEIFIESAETDIEKLHNALETNDCEAASSAAHSLKGSAGNLGFTEISELSASLENQARNNDIGNLPAAIPTLSHLLSEIKGNL